MRERSQKQLTDIIERCRAGDGEAWHLLMDLVAPMIFALCKKSQLTRDESFDILGQVSLELINAIDSLKSPEKILSFVATITRRQIYGFYQKIHIVDYVGEEMAVNLPADPLDNPEKQYENMRKREILLEAMLKLSDRDYRLIYSLFLDPGEPSYKEIAARLHMPVSSIGPIRAKALARLYRLLRTKLRKL